MESYLLNKLLNVNQMKIAYLLGSLNRGGSETLMLDVFRNASSEKLNCIGIYRKSGVLEKEFQNTGIAMFFLSFAQNKISYLYKLRRLLKQERINIVHAQQFLDAFFAWFVCIGTGIRIVLTTHGYDFNENRIEKKMHQFVLNHTDVNFFVSQFQCNYYINKYRLKPQKQIVVYNGISFRKFETFDFKSIRDELGLDDKTLLIGSVGNFNEVRDQYSLCRFAKLLSEKFIDFHLIFIGETVDNKFYRYDQCVSFCETNSLMKYISFLGSRSDIPNILNQLDAFVYASDHDTFGIAVVEAMAVGIPVFVNDWGVMTEIAENGKFATLYKTKDETDLLEKFMTFLLNSNHYKIKATETSEIIRKKYSIKKHIERLKLLYKTLLTKYS